MDEALAWATRVANSGEAEHRLWFKDEASKCRWVAMLAPHWYEGVEDAGSVCASIRREGGKPDDGLLSGGGNSDSGSCPDLLGKKS